jgi:predicted MFS family arabinose efflux permease
MSAKSIVSQTFAALQYPNYRAWFIGQLFSLVGTWMQSTAQGYLIFQLTHSDAYLGYVAFISGIPTILFSLYGGVVADRIPRRKLMVFTQTTMLVLAFILAGLTFAGWVQPWHILVLAFMLGVANAFDAPARQSFVVEMVDRKDLTNAIALNATMFNLALVVGPAAGGLVYAWVGPGWCFTFNGLSFVAVIIALLWMRLPPFAPLLHRESANSQIREGFRFVMGNPTVRLLIFSVAFMSAFGLGLVTLIPAWATVVLGGDVTTNGLLLSARGVGSVLGALMLAALGGRGLRGRFWVGGSFVVPLAMLFFTLTRMLPLSMLGLGIAGWSLMAVINNSNALVQTQIPDQIRGRVMGIYMLIFMGATPLGSLWIGTLAEYLGEPVAVQINAAILLVFSLWVFFWHPEIRRLE